MSTFEPASRRRGFTLLEAILALAILGAAAAACLQLRAQLTLAGAKLQKRAAIDNAADTLFHEVINGLLPDGRADGAGVVVWTGVHLGAPYRVERRRETVPNPVTGVVAYPVARSLDMYRYEITIGGETGHFLWHK